jgi:hypothetical protein
MDPKAADYLAEALEFEQLAGQLLDRVTDADANRVRRRQLAWATWQAAECYVSAYLLEVSGLTLTSYEARMKQLGQEPRFWTWPTSGPWEWQASVMAAYMELYRNTVDAQNNVVTADRLRTGFDTLLPSLAGGITSVLQAGA